MRKYLFASIFGTVFVFSNVYAQFKPGANIEKIMEYFNQAQTCFAAKNYSCAILNYKKAYEAGDCLMSPRQLARIYQEGLLGEINYSEFVKWAKIAADEGNDVDSQRELATSYYMGVGVSKNLSSSFYYYNKAANNGDVYSMYCLGMAYYNAEGCPKDLKKAAYWYEQAASREGKGSSGAANNLAWMYGRGEVDGSENIQMAVKWFLVAAEKGDRNAQLTVGNVYLEGYGVPKDKNKAVYWLRKAAEQGVTQAQIILAQLGY